MLPQKSQNHHILWVGGGSLIAKTDFGKKHIKLKIFRKGNNSSAQVKIFSSNFKLLPTKNEKKLEMILGLMLVI